jgi:hypothetical protein
MAEEQQKREDENNEIKEMGTLNMKESGSKYGIQLLTIIGEIEGHDSVSGNTKATKYEHLLPRLARSFNFIKYAWRRCGSRTGNS